MPTPETRSDHDRRSDATPSVREVLGAAVASLGGHERPGQVQMAEAVAGAMTDRTHLLVQAGTGTGKSLGYLVPALLHDDRVVVATATLALQHQLVERDLPALITASQDVLARTPSYSVLKGRGNYACLHRVREGVPDDQGALVDLPQGSLGSEVLELRTWAEEEAERRGPGDRDSAPRHTDRAWRQVSVSHRECLGAARCPFGTECFVEVAREEAARADVVVTNHSMLAIDAIEGVPMIPEYDVVVVDEAHELTARVTQASTQELTPTQVERATRRAERHVSGIEADDLGDAAEALRDAIASCAPGRIDAMPEGLADALAATRDAARALVSGFGKETADDAGATQAKAWVQEVFVTAERMAARSGTDVIWATDREAARGGPGLSVAPLQVWGPLRDRLLASKTVVFTSATLKLGGDFDALAGTLGLLAREQIALGDAGASGATEDAGGREDDDRRAAVAGRRRRLALRLRQAGDPVRRRPPSASRVATGSGSRRSTRSWTSSTPPTGAPWGCSRADGRRRPPRRRCGNGFRT